MKTIKFILVSLLAMLGLAAEAQKVEKSTPLTTDSVVYADEEMNYYFFGDGTTIGTVNEWNEFETIDVTKLEKAKSWPYGKETLYIATNRNHTLICPYDEVSKFRIQDCALPHTTIEINGKKYLASYSNDSDYENITLLYSGDVSKNLTATSSNSSMGSVSGSGTYDYGETVTFAATPNKGYSFVKWSDGNLANPYAFQAKKDITLTAIFKAISAATYTISATSSNSAMGSVSGGGTYEEGVPVTLIATPNIDHKFVKWSDGSTANPYTFVAKKDISITATFEELPEKYYFFGDGTTIGTVNEWEEFETIDVTKLKKARSWPFGKEAHYTTKNENYTVVCPYEDYQYLRMEEQTYVRALPSTVFFIDGKQYLASFSQVRNGCDMTLIYKDTPVIYVYTINATSSNESMGTVTGGQMYYVGQSVKLTATPKSGYRFVKWSDGTTANPYTFKATKNVTLTATFEKTAPTTYTITVTSANTTMGTVSGGGTYEEGKTVTLTATPKSGYRFVKWSDGSTQNPYTFKATKNVTLTATFEKIPTTTYTITVTSANTTMGTVSGGGTYEEGKTVTLTATPNQGYRFVKWSDGSTQNPYTFKATKNVTLTANFEKIPVKSDVLKADDVKANKCYIIYTEERGGLTVTSESDTRIWGTGESSVSQEVDAKNKLQHFAFVKENGNLYLYSVAAGKFVSATEKGELTEKPSAPISFANADAETVRLVFDADHNINLGGNKQIVIDDWTKKDAGNSFVIMEAADFSGVVTGLATIVTDNTVTPMYDLQGRMVKCWPGRRGVSIVNGRKIIK